MRLWLALGLLLVPAFAGCLDSLVGGGVSPSDYVSSKTYRKLVVEIDYATGKAPSSELQSFLKGRLQSVVDKPDGVDFRLDESLGDASRTWTDSAIRSYASDHASLKTEGNQAVLHVLFLAGHYQTSGVLGVTYGRGPIAIFSEDVDGMCSGLVIPGTCSTAPFYHSVVLHEMGHALGLVNNGLSMVHNHEASTCDHGNGNVQQDQRHSSNSNSVMFCGVEQAGLLGTLGSTPPNDFDSDDRADIHAAGGK